MRVDVDTLEVVLERTRALHVDARLCLGDLVGYNAHPSECLTRLDVDRVHSAVNELLATAGATLRA